MIEEKWAEIAGFPDYAVSNHGRVKSLRYGTYLNPRTNSYGHQRVVLYRDKEGHERSVHRLVAEAFIDGYRPEYKVKPHDGDHTNNNVYNLRFAKGHRLGQLVRAPRPARERRVMVIETGMIFRTVKDCANYIGGMPSSIYRVLRGDRPSHLGYTFAYVEES